jgi:hypothetical protein
MCTDTPGSYTCTCVAGYAAGGPGGGGTCADVDECAAGLCGPGASACFNSVGSYACTCLAGYQTPGPGNPCTDINECAAGGCGAGVATCTNMGGSYACTCTSGYTVTGPGAPCVDANECTMGTPCGAGLGTCSNLGGTYSCACSPGYGAPPTGGTCANINECALGTDDCTDAPAGVCTDTLGSFTCACTPSFPFGTGRGASGCLTRFTDLGDGTTRDNNGSGREWQRTLSVASGALNQAQAVAHCSSLTLDGGGWRLPTHPELMSIVDTSLAPMIDQTFFPGAPTQWFWTSTVFGPGAHRYVDFVTGSPSTATSSNAPLFARCVR